MGPSHRTVQQRAKTPAALRVCYVFALRFILRASFPSECSKVIYEMATGLDRLRFPDTPSKSPTAVVKLMEVLMRACHEDPRDRFQSAAALREALAACRPGVFPESVQDLQSLLV